MPNAQVQAALSRMPGEAEVRRRVQDVTRYRQLAKQELAKMISRKL